MAPRDGPAGRESCCDQTTALPCIATFPAASHLIGSRLRMPRRCWPIPSLPRSIRPGGVPQEKGINRDNNPRFKLKKQILRGWQGHQDEKTEEKLAKTDKNSETPKENLGSLNHPSFLRHQDE